MNKDTELTAEGSNIIVKAMKRAGWDKAGKKIKRPVNDPLVRAMKKSVLIGSIKIALKDCFLHIEERITKLKIPPEKATGILVYLSEKVETTTKELTTQVSKMIKEGLFDKEPTGRKKAK